MQTRLFLTQQSALKIHVIIHMEPVRKMVHVLVVQFTLVPTAINVLLDSFITHFVLVPLSPHPFLLIYLNCIECTAALCSYHGTCALTGDNFACTCTSAYTGQYCETCRYGGVYPDCICMSHT